MIKIPMNIKGALDRNTIGSLNQNHRPQNIFTPVSDKDAQTVKPAARPRQQQIPQQQPIPNFIHPIQKGQKVALASAGSLHAVDACFGWNIKDARCDVDVSAFLLGENGKVPGDSWFVFYGQTKSPDKSTEFFADASGREKISIDFDRLNPNVKKIVFVLTINEAFEQNLHFEMIKDAYIRILHPDTKAESVSFQMTDYYSNVISMMIGEIYQHNGTWKFGAVGNGVAKDLAGLCSLYGVQTS